MYVKREIKEYVVKKRITLVGVIALITASLMFLNSTKLFGKMTASITPVSSMIFIKASIRRLLR